MKLVFGIGNYGSKYLKTRHNAGFIILDKLAEKLNLEFISSEFNFYYCKGQYKNSDFVLIKPKTYVNLSGIAAKQALDFFEVQPNNLMVLSDDINLNEGEIRIRRNGGDGGHNGLSSIIFEMITEEFSRLRYGVGKYLGNEKMADFVLSNYFDFSNKNQLESINFAVEILLEYISSDMEGALNYYSKNFNKSFEQT